MTKWIKPSGVVVELNDVPENIAAAKANKWKLKGVEKETPKKEDSKPKAK
jgi:hypothetical protein